MKVFVINGGTSYSRMYEGQGYEVVYSMTEADLVHFTGGEDVSPELYGEEMHPYTGNNPARDEQEAELFFDAIRLGKYLVGECRGAQFLNVMCGGGMWQHVDGHAIAGQHDVTDTRTGNTYSTTSTHHQMMRPTAQAEIIGVSHESSYYEYMDGKVKRVEPDEDVEVVYYEQGAGVLCFQGHPEYTEKGDSCQEYFFQLLQEKFVCAD